MIIPNPIRSINTIDSMLASGDFFMLWILLVPLTLRVIDAITVLHSRVPFVTPN